MSTQDEPIRRRWASAATQIGCTLTEYVARKNNGEKWCYSCTSWLPLEAFANNLHRPDGRSGQCKGCVTVWQTAYRARKAAEREAGYAARHPHGPPQISAWRPGRRDTPEAPPDAPGATGQGAALFPDEVGIYAAAKARRLAAREARRAEREQA